MEPDSKRPGVPAWETNPGLLIGAGLGTFLFTFSASALVGISLELQPWGLPAGLVGLLSAIGLACAGGGALVGWLYDHTRDLSFTDPLTGVFNRRYFFWRLDREMRAARKRGHSLSVALFDVDHFKEVNDQQGHLSGDQVLRAIAQVIRASLRGTGFIARYGGDEFVVLLPRTARSTAFALADRIRQEFAYAGLTSPAAGSGAPRITLSGGVASFPDDGSTARQVIAIADRALYEAKQFRNRVLTSGQLSAPGQMSTPGGLSTSGELSELAPATGAAVQSGGEGLE